jgi:hypothetical protein
MGHRRDYIKAARTHIVEQYGPWLSGASILLVIGSALTTTFGLTPIWDAPPGALAASVLILAAAVWILIVETPTDLWHRNRERAESRADALRRAEVEALARASADRIRRRLSQEAGNPLLHGALVGPPSATDEERDLVTDVEAKVRSRPRHRHRHRPLLPPRSPLRG